MRLALTTFESFGMIEVVDGTITIPNWEKHQAVDAVERYKEQTRERVASYRQRQKAIAAENSSVTQSNVTRNVTCNVTCNVDVTPCNAIEEDIDKDIEEDIKEIDKEKPTRHKYGEYQNVLLSDEDLEKLKKEFFDWSDRIERLSAYMASTGKSYKNHLATIRSWARQKSRAKKRALQAVNDMSLTCQQSQGIEEDIDKDIEGDIKEIDKESFRFPQLLILERFRFWKLA